MSSFKGALIGLCMAAQAVAAPRVAVTIDATHPGPVINKDLYGQVVAEVAGGGAGAWVGPGAAIPNTRGWRKDVVGALRALRVPLVRWPGGCVADQYHWRDGIGPRARRPANAVGTHEFFDLVEAIGAAAYVNGNAGTGSAREAADWVEYMVANGGSTLARLRAGNGRTRAFKPAFFGVGGAPWSCGGNMTPQYYADLYNEYAVFISGKSDHPPKLVASGSGSDWTDELSTKKRVRDYRDGISIHDDGIAGEMQWVSTLNRASHMDAFIASNVAKLDQNDPNRRMFLVIGEWRTRDDPASWASPVRQPSSLRDALAAVLHFHVFQAHADRLRMANYASPVNGPGALILAKGDKMVLTPTYHVFKMHVPFQGATALPVRLANDPQYVVGGTGIPALSVSAARGKNGKLYLSFVNTNPNEAVEASIEVAGGVPKAASGSVLTAGAMDAQNSFFAPVDVVPVPLRARAGDGTLLVTLPAKSVAVVAVRE